MTWLTHHWYRISVAHFFLWPLSMLFRLIVALRRCLYRTQLFSSTRLPVPVIVVGNLTVGGSGKTPLVLWLVDMLRQHGYVPGIISRGYGAHIEHATEVKVDSLPREVGDEPLLLARRAHCPIWVCPDRVAAARELLRAHPECNIIIADDGLQHYRLQRDVEIAVVDGERQFGNGLMLPAGPLREPLARLREVDIVVTHKMNDSENGDHPFQMHLAGQTFVQLQKSEIRRNAADFANLRVHAVAGIGNPQRFFDYLKRLGLVVIPHAFDDHHDFSHDDIAFADADAILMTEKDAVKCATIADERCWALIVDAQVSSGLTQTILEKLHGR